MQPEIDEKANVVQQVLLPSPGARYRFHVVELAPMPPEHGASAWSTVQRDVVVRDSIEAAQEVVDVLLETSMGDEVYAIQARLVV